METVNLILSLIANKGITEQNFLSDLGYNRTLLSDWKSGKSKSYKKNISEIATYFNVSTDYLLGKTENPTATNDNEVRVSDDDIKFALFSGSEDITDEMFDEVKRFAQYIANEKKRKADKKV